MILRVRLVVVKRFPENTYFPEMLISGKGKCFPLFGCLGNRFPEYHFRCLVGPNILRKSWVGARVRRSEWIGAMFSLVRGSFVDRSAGSWVGARVRRSEWIGAMFSLVRGSERCAWVGAMCVGRSSLVRGSEWIGDLDSGSERVLSGSFYELGAWIGAHRDRIGLGRSTGSLDRSALSTSMCCCAWIDPVLLCVRWFSVSLLSSLCVAVRGDVIRK